MNTMRLILLLLLTICFSLAAALLPRAPFAGSDRQANGDLATVLLGEGRRLFANHFFVKADVYMHSGFYPTIFDGAKLHDGKNATSHAAGGGDTPSRSDFLGEPRDWLDRFSRNFYITRHTHLGDAETGAGSEREILPWLLLAASLDPQRVETYTVAAYWLRSHLGKTEEAEALLRAGRRENPDSYEILFELGRLTSEHRKDDLRARNLLELGLRKWNEQEATKAESDQIAKAQLVGALARLEERNGNFPKAIEYLQQLKLLSPVPAAIQLQIDELQAQMRKPDR